MSATSDTVGHFFCTLVAGSLFSSGYRRVELQSFGDPDVTIQIYGERAVSKVGACLVECVFLVPSKSQRFVDVHSYVTTRCEG